MKPRTFMVIAGEPSGDMVAAELVEALRQEFRNARPIDSSDYQPLYASFEPRFFGAGGSHLAAAGVELAFDLTADSTIGFTDVFKKYFKLRRIFFQLLDLALRRQPDAIICVDYAGFNRRFGHALREHVQRPDWFHDWRPKLIQYVSPQVWASRPGRAAQIAEDFDLLLSIVPFEKEWYAKRVPQLRVEFVGDPIVDRHGSAQPASKPAKLQSPFLLLLPGSRPKELERHMPVMLGALRGMRATYPGLQARIVLPNERLAQQAKTIGVAPEVELQIGNLADALTQADVAIAATGTVTRECAWFGVPTVGIYKTAWATYQLAKRIVKVNFAAMPNLLANEEIFPEFIQDAATPENIAQAALELLQDENRRQRVKSKLAEIRAMLGTPGASRRAARYIVGLLSEQPSIPRSRGVKR